MSSLTLGCTLESSLGDLCSAEPVDDSIFVLFLCLGRPVGNDHLCVGFSSCSQRVTLHKVCLLPLYLLQGETQSICVAPKSCSAEWSPPHACISMLSLALDNVDRASAYVLTVSFRGGELWCVARLAPPVISLILPRLLLGFFSFFFLFSFLAFSFHVISYDQPLAVAFRGHALRMSLPWLIGGGGNILY